MNPDRRERMQGNRAERTMKRLVGDIVRESLATWESFAAEDWQANYKVTRGKNAGQTGWKNTKTGRVSYKEPRALRAEREAKENPAKKPRNKPGAMKSILKPGLNEVRREIAEVRDAFSRGKGTPEQHVPTVAAALSRMTVPLIRQLATEFGVKGDAKGSKQKVADALARRILRLPEVKPERKKRTPKQVVAPDNPLLGKIREAMGGRSDEEILSLLNGPKEALTAAIGGGGAGGGGIGSRPGGRKVVRSATRGAKPATPAPAPKPVSLPPLPPAAPEPAKAASVGPREVDSMEKADRIILSGRTFDNRDAIKGIQGATFDKEKKTWIIPREAWTSGTKSRKAVQDVLNSLKRKGVHHSFESDD